jgi:hypothetical protein
VRTPPPSGLLTSAPTPPPRLLSLRPVLAGLAVLAIGVPIVLLLPTPARKAAVRVATPAVVRSAQPSPARSVPAPARPPATPVPVTRPTIGPVVLVPKSAARPAPPKGTTRPPGHPRAAAASTPSTPRASAHRPPAWVRAECARRFPHDPVRRNACTSLVTATLTH